MTKPLIEREVKYWNIYSKALQDILDKCRLEFEKRIDDKLICVRRETGDGCSHCITKRIHKEIYG